MMLLSHLNTLGKLSTPRILENILTLEDQIQIYNVGYTTLKQVV